LEAQEKFNTRNFLPTTIPSPTFLILRVKVKRVGHRPQQNMLD